jgi:acetyl-CoA synthetase
MSGYAWEPTAEYVESANVTRLARRHGLPGITELRSRSVEDIAWYWDAVVADLGLVFRRPYDAVVDLSAGVEWPEWFIGGACNVADSCLTRWTADPGHAGAAAVIHEDEQGRVHTLTYAELRRDVEAAAAGLRRLGLQRGDAIALLLPMRAEAVVTLLAIAWIGAIAVPLFSGFAAGAIAARLQDAEARAVVVAVGTVRRGRVVPLKSVLTEALAHCPSVRDVIVVGGPAESQGEIAWPDLIAGGSAPSPPEAMTPQEPLLLAYTSGTTGRPKGAVHTHSGFLVKTASEVAYSFDMSPGRVFMWMTDMGWIMGPLSIVGTLANGACLLMYEGAPDAPDLGRLWALAERHRVSMLGVSPTLVRTVRAGAPGAADGVDLSSVRILGSTGEPWDPASYEWMAAGVFEGRVPVINFSGGTEVGGSLLAPYPVERIRTCSVGGPSLGMDVDVVDRSGAPVRGQTGELVCRQPWPSMTRGVWRDEQRYLDSYWSTFPGVWRHGDFAVIDADGQWFVQGRSDDVMNIAGKRLAPAEIESLVAMHPAVAEVAAVGVPDAQKGESAWLFWVARPTQADPESVSLELRQQVAEGIGRPFAPARVYRVEQLPKTRSAKIMRRAVRAAALGTDPGDLSGLENPEALSHIRDVVSASPSPQ